MIEPLVRQSTFTSFDGRVTGQAWHQRPDRYSHIELPEAGAHRIARGGGYSYSAASFGDDTLVQDMSCFNRFLAYDEAAGTLCVEPGVTLHTLMAWALPRHLYFPVLPGYPRITVGGCVAVDAHGKNPRKDGTFTDWVAGLTVYHPDKGLQECSRDENPELFALTCGGFGLTGIITRVRLRLQPLRSTHFLMNQRPVGTLVDAVEALNAADNDIAYSWHDLAPGPNFGHGIVHLGDWSSVAADLEPRDWVPPYFAMTARSRRALPFSLWNRYSARAANQALLYLGKRQKPSTPTDIFAASFPFARNPFFHLFFGRPGLHECQILVGDTHAQGFLRALEALVQTTRAPTMMASIKAFCGTGRALSMAGDGYLVTLVCYHSNSIDAFLQAVDQLTLEFQGQPNLTKDSRVPGAVVEASLPHFGAFKDRLFAYDPARLMRSALSARLGLL